MVDAKFRFDVNSAEQAKESSFVAIFIAINIVGLSIVGVWTNLVGVVQDTSRFVSVPFRIALVLCSLFMFIRFPRRNGSVWYIVLMLFMSGYMTRLCVDLFKGYPLGADYALMLFLAASVLPALAIAGLPRPEIEMEKAAVWLSGFASIIAVGVLVMKYKGILDTDELVGGNIGRLQAGLINPISLGHVMVSGMLSMAYAKGKASGMVARAVKLCAFLICLMGLAYCQSRGAMVALAMSSIAVAAIKRSIVPLVIVCLAVAIYVFVLTGFSEVSGRTTQSILQDAPRLLLWAAGINQFLGSPLTGSAYLVLGNILGEADTYPHNLIIESFMATGVFGGLTVLTLILVVLRKAAGIAKLGSPLILVLLVQYIVEGQFSGGIFGASQIWLLMSLTLALQLKTQRHSQKEGQTWGHNKALN